MPLPPGPPSWNHTRTRGPLPSPPWNSCRHPTPCLVETRPLGFLLRDFKCEAVFVPTGTQSVQACAFKRQYSPYICCVLLQRTVIFQCLVEDRIWTKQSLKVFLRVCVCVYVTHEASRTTHSVCVSENNYCHWHSVSENSFFSESREEKREISHLFTLFCTVLHLSLDHLTVAYTKRD